MSSLVAPLRRLSTVSMGEFLKWVKIENISELSGDEDEDDAKGGEDVKKRLKLRVEATLGQEEQSCCC